MAVAPLKHINLVYCFCLLRHFRLVHAKKGENSYSADLGLMVGGILLLFCFFFAFHWYLKWKERKRQDMRLMDDQWHWSFLKLILQSIFTVCGEICFKLMRGWSLCLRWIYISMQSYGNISSISHLMIMLLKLDILGHKEEWESLCQRRRASYRITSNLARFLV